MIKMCKRIFKRKKNQTKSYYIRNDEVEKYKEKIKGAFDSIKEKVEEAQKKCMAITNKGNRCKNNALEEDDYCYRHKALYG